MNKTFVSFKFCLVGDEKMAQQLTAHTSLSEDASSLPQHPHRFHLNVKHDVTELQGLCSHVPTVDTVGVISSSFSWS